MHIRPRTIGFDGPFVETATDTILVSYGARMASSVIVGTVVVVGVALFVWWTLVLIEALRTPTSQWEASGQSQIVYVVLMVLVGVIGTIAYVVVARPQLRSAGSSASSRL